MSQAQRCATISRTIDASMCRAIADVNVCPNEYIERVVLYRNGVPLGEMYPDPVVPGRYVYGFTGQMIPGGTYTAVATICARRNISAGQDVQDTPCG